MDGTDGSRRPIDATVEVWVRATTSSAGVPGAAAPTAAGLDGLERERWSRLVDRRDATAYLVLHALARHEIGRLLGRPPASLRFDRTCPDCGRQHGAPRLLDDPGLYLSLSRTRAVVALALSRAGPLGVDVEAVDAVGFTGYDDVALHPDERPRGARELTDATTWVRKEAALKALGVGLRVDPATFATPAPGVPTEIVPGMPSVTVVDLDVPSAYAAAVALASAAGALAVRAH
ncbi:4'-phosphopantetheinyl transferase superfamily protein [Terracoccus sp. 273MFTsu3.1]|uniref:4'-phosphopantetheinyl transferase family protein n=1 Tax=Terracoccus sp. 273MFTsu3.1 TaxID=1172188 RepID=UPI00037CDAFA|nr:4'-phosphopantetheinyl transferase superfamily protein [Terracoccus sp. 273MFTsu3.1]